MYPQLAEENTNYVFGQYINALNSFSALMEVYDSEDTIYFADGFPKLMTLAILTHEVSANKLDRQTHPYPRHHG